MKKTILIIDDEVDVSELIKMRLTVDGNYHVVPLYTSTRALEIAKREKPNLILLDIAMPDKDGYEVCKELKADEETRDIPVILFTAQTAEKKDITEQYQSVGADDCILKPFDEDKLIAKIKALAK
jgi:two-component system alkaline phosphatase synthesis response regulator PhoP